MCATYNLKKGSVSSARTPRSLAAGMSSAPPLDCPNAVFSESAKWNDQRSPRMGETRRAAEEDSVSFISSKMPESWVIAGINPRKTTTAR
jgi:hypothetical protein